MGRKITKHEWEDVAKGKFVHEQKCKHCPTIRVKIFRKWGYHVGNMYHSYKPPCITRRPEQEAGTNV